MPGVNILDVDSVQYAIDLCQQCDAFSTFLREIHNAVQDENTAAEKIKEEAVEEESRTEKLLQNTEQRLDQCEKVRDGCQGRFAETQDHLEIAGGDCRTAESNLEGAKTLLSKAKNWQDRCEQEVKRAEQQVRQNEKTLGQAERTCNAAENDFQNAISYLNAARKAHVEMHNAIVKAANNARSAGGDIDVDAANKKMAEMATMVDEAQRQAIAAEHALAAAKDQVIVAQNQLAQSRAALMQAKDELLSANVHHNQCVDAIRVCQVNMAEAQNLHGVAEANMSNAEYQLREAEDAESEAVRQRDMVQGDYENACVMTQETEEHRKMVEFRGKAIADICESHCKGVENNVERDIQAVRTIYSHAEQYIYTR